MNLMQRLIRWGLLMAGCMVATVGVVAVGALGPGESAGARTAPRALAALMGTAADIAPSADHHRADRKAEENRPEIWLGLMWYAHQPLNKLVARSGAFGDIGRDRFRGRETAAITRRELMEDDCWSLSAHGRGRPQSPATR